ncbi:hypothetical protein BC835DRAFT_1342556 [Cytidiella melzeri]|nr:hypothetical protein BC835DRAFT_1342556 [Cytidiella melzeri]
MHQQTMELHATHADPLNTQLLDAQDRPVYEIATKRRVLHHSTTTISKPTPLGTVAEFEWHRRLSNSVLQFRGRSTNVKDYISKAGFWSSKQHFTSSSGRQYTWDENIVRWIPRRLFRALCF